MQHSGQIARAIIPASTANLGPGFDALGMALPLFTGIDMQLSGQTRIRAHGHSLKDVALDKSNLVYQAAQQLFAKAGVHAPELDIVIESEIPLARGLGSSAAAIVGALAAANALIDAPFTDEELFQLATAMERHPDNVGASMFGGFVAAAWDGQRAEAIRFDPPQALEVLAVIPDFELPTKQARDALPRAVPLEDAVFNVGNSSLLVAAMASGRLQTLRHAMRDRLHQPYREDLVPGMADILQGAAEHGALAAVLSGAGPTLLLLADKRENDRDKLEHFAANTMLNAGTDTQLIWMNPCIQGTTVTTLASGKQVGSPLAEQRKHRPEVNV